MLGRTTLFAASVFLMTGCTTAAYGQAVTTSPTDQRVSVSTPATAPNSNGMDGRNLLDGTRINWTYNSSGASMALSFQNGLAEYIWTAGSRQGRSAKDIPYNSRKIGEDMYLINWVQPEKPDFITLIFDFENDAAYSSGLIGYGTERQRNLFLDGTIDSVKR